MSVLSLRRQHDPLHFEGAIAKDIRAADATASRRALRVQCALTIGYAESADASFRPSADLPKTNGKNNEIGGKNSARLRSCGVCPICTCVSYNVSYIEAAFLASLDCALANGAWSPAGFLLPSSSLIEKRWRSCSGLNRWLYIGKSFRQLHERAQ